MALQAQSRIAHGYISVNISQNASRVHMISSALQAFFQQSGMGLRPEMEKQTLATTSITNSTPVISLAFCSHAG